MLCDELGSIRKNRHDAFESQLLFGFGDACSVGTEQLQVALVNTRISKDLVGRIEFNR